MVASMIRGFLGWLVVALKLQARVITRDDDAAYLRRWYLLGEPGGLKYFADQELRWWQKLLTWAPCVYIHQFASSDTDDELHNHPWEAVSLILAGGYAEERRVESAAFDSVDAWLRGRPAGYKVVIRDFKPGSINHLFADTFHKVTLLEADCWTLIVIGKRVQSWGFWSPLTGRFLGWRDHHAMKTDRKMNAKGGST
jgi:hypothetical protein